MQADVALCNQLYSQKIQPSAHCFTLIPFTSFSAYGWSWSKYSQTLVKLIVFLLGWIPREISTEDIRQRNTILRWAIDWMHIALTTTSSGTCSPGDKREVVRSNATAGEGAVTPFTRSVARTVPAGGQAAGRSSHHFNPHRRLPHGNFQNSFPSSNRETPLFRSRHSNNDRRLGNNSFS